jgi:hypothetical protein
MAAKLLSPKGTLNPKILVWATSLEAYIKLPITNQDQGCVGDTISAGGRGSGMGR